MALKVTAVESDNTAKNTPFETVDYKDGATLEIYGINHPLYQLAIERIEERKLAEDIFNLNENSYRFETQVEVIGNYLVKGWTGFVDAKENPLEPNGVNFKQACLSYPDLLIFVIQNAIRIQHEQPVKTEQLKKKR